MPRRRLLALAAGLSLLPAALAVPVAAQDAPAPPVATPNPEAMAKPAGDGTGVRLTTDKGDIVIGLFNESAPVAAENFVNLVNSGYYDGTGFHRVVRDFVIQGGDPEGTGRGGPGYTIVDEEVVGTYERGIVAMARTPAPNSQGSQFFVVLDDAAQPALESARTYVIFGRVLEGMDVVDAIAEQGPEADVIEDPVRIISAQLEVVELPNEPDPPPPSTAKAAADALTALVPASLGGLAVGTTTFSSEQILPGLDEDPSGAALFAAAETNDADINGLSIVNAGAANGDVSFGVAAASLPGVPASESWEALSQLLGVVVDGADVTSQAIGGHDVTTVRTASGAGWEGTVHVIESGDVVWLVVAPEGLFEQIIDELPIEQT